MKESCPANNIEESKKPLLSVIIATFGRKDVLKITLEKLTKQTFSMSDFEVVVVDDGSRDGTIEMIESMKETLPYKLHCFSQERRGPGGANNRGAKEARADLILFLANDMHATPRTLEAHYEYHLENPEPHIAVVGKLQGSPELPKTAFQKRWNPFRGKGLDGKKELDEFDFWISNLSMKREFFLRNGLFLEYPAAAFEDLELASRLFKKGLKMIYHSEALTYHYHTQTVDSAIRRIYETGRNFHLYEENVHDDAFYKKYKVLSNKMGFLSNMIVFLISLIRSSLFNRITIPYLVVPLIRKGETNRLVEPFIGFLGRRVLGYYFRKGISESRRRRQKENAGDAVN